MVVIHENFTRTWASWQEQLELAELEAHAALLIELLGEGDRLRWDYAAEFLDRTGVAQQAMAEAPRTSRSRYVSHMAHERVQL